MPWLLNDLLAPTPPGNKSFAYIAAALRNHFEPKRSVIAERFHFHKREQGVGETIAEFDAALRKLAVHCQFGEKLETSLRDRFVCGLRHDAIQHRLLSETTYADLPQSIQDLREIARGMESADNETKAFQSPDPAIKKLGTRSQKPKAFQSCYRCGRSNHRPADCKFKEAQCHSSGKTGHIAPVCRSKPL